MKCIWKRRLSSFLIEKSFLGKSEYGNSSIKGSVNITQNEWRDFGKTNAQVKSEIKKLLKDGKSEEEILLKMKRFFEMGDEAFEMRKDKIYAVITNIESIDTNPIKDERKK